MRIIIWMEQYATYPIIQSRPECLFSIHIPFFDKHELIPIPEKEIYVGYSIKFNLNTNNDFKCIEQKATTAVVLEEEVFNYSLNKKIHLPDPNTISNLLWHPAMLNAKYDRIQILYHEKMNLNDKEFIGKDFTGNRNNSQQI